MTDNFLRKYLPVFIIAIVAICYLSFPINEEGNFEDTSEQQFRTLNIEEVDDTTTPGDLLLVNDGRKVAQLVVNPDKDNEQLMDSIKEEPDEVRQKQNPGMENEFGATEIDDANAEVLREVAKDEDWQKYLSLVEELTQDASVEESLLSESLLIAIVNNAPLDVFRELLARGAKFTWVHLNLLTSSNKLALMQELENLGLDIHLTSGNGENAVYIAMKLFKAREVFEYLLIRGVSVEGVINEKDYLEFALKGAEKFERACLYTVGLINHGGIQVKESHVETLRKLKTRNPQNFSCIVTNLGYDWGL